jgi:hypothetical protein
LQQALRRGHAACGGRADRHTGGSPVDREISMVPARTRFRAARSQSPSGK